MSISPIVRRLLAWCSIALPLYFLAAGGCVSAKNPRADLARLQGTWQLVYQLMNGQKLPDEQDAQLLHGQVVFGPETLRYTSKSLVLIWNSPTSFTRNRNPKRSTCS